MPGRPALPDVDTLLDTAVGALGGTRREGQHEMAAAVDEAVTTGSHLLVQAGTGTGKSLAYLVPLVRRAVETSRPVVVATATLALQAQVVERDLPALSSALAGDLGRVVTHQTVKGRSNYVCLHKLHGGFPDDEPSLFDVPGADATGRPASPTSALGRDVVRLRQWADETDSGDRDDLVPGVSERAWRQVSVTAFECLGAAKCPQAAACFSENARARAREVDVVVTNHALLAIDAFEGRQILPEHRVLVVDEAHELSDRVTSVVSDELTAAMVTTAASRARAHGGVDGSRLDAGADDLAAVLAALPGGRLAQGLGESLRVVIVSIRDAAREAASALRPAPGAAADEAAEAARQLARAAVTEVFDVTERLAAEVASDVAWVSVTEPRVGPVRRALHVAPLSVADPLRERLFSERSVVLTSATLTVGGSFDPLACQVGLAGDEAPEWKGLDVGSPFDYGRQAVLYVASHLPPPGRDGLADATLDELAELVEAAGGRTLGLFSSRRAAEQAAEAMRQRLDVEVLCQGDDTTPTLVRQLASDARTCLFGTLSLWQGVDVPGPACQLVVIDRIPFPRPDDPLMSARTQDVARRGGNGFMSVSATHAALRLAQGAGRLIRSTTDRGVVAVLDPRLATARYGGYLRASLPPMWATTDAALVREALRRLDAAAPEVVPLAPRSPASASVSESAT